MLASFVSFLVLSTAAFSFASAQNSTTPSPDPSRFQVVTKRGPWVPVGVDLVGPAYQAVEWGELKFEPEQKWPCIFLGYSKWFPGGDLCPRVWYDYTKWKEQPGSACPNNTLSKTGGTEPGSPRWVSVSTTFLNQNGSLRKSCGRTVEVTANNRTVLAEVRRSCDAGAACPGENAIALSPYVAHDLGIQNELVDGKQVTWTYL